MGMDTNGEKQCKYLEEENSRTKCRAHIFQVPLHYPRFTKADYEAMPESQLDTLLAQYGLPVEGDLAYKRKYAMGAFLWPDALR